MKGPVPIGLTVLKVKLRRFSASSEPRMCSGTIPLTSEYSNELRVFGNVKLTDEAAPSSADAGAIKAGFEALYDYLTDERLPDDGHAAEAASILGEVLGSDEAGSFRTTLSRNLKWMVEPSCGRPVIVA